MVLLKLENMMGSLYKFPRRFEVDGSQNWVSEAGISFFT
jgi:hypothetical protein